MIGQNPSGFGIQIGFILYSEKILTQTGWIVIFKSTQIFVKKSLLLNFIICLNKKPSEETARFFDVVLFDWIWHVWLPILQQMKITGFCEAINRILQNKIRVFYFIVICILFRNIKFIFLGLQIWQIIDLNTLYGTVGKTVTKNKFWILLSY